MELYDVVIKLIGPIEAVGCQGTDGKRLKNLKEMTHLVDKLLYDIQDVVPNKLRVEGSMKNIGEHASDFIKDIKNMEDI